MFFFFFFFLHFHFIHISFKCMIFIWLFFMISISKTSHFVCIFFFWYCWVLLLYFLGTPWALLKQLFCFFLFRFVCFFWCTETAILNFLPGILQIFMSLCVAIVILWLCYFTLILHISFALLSLHLKWKSLPWVFTVFGVRNNLLQPC